MAEDNNKNGTTDRLSKRNLLKGTGAIAGGLAMPFGQVTAAVDPKYNGEHVLMTPSANNALTPSEVVKIQREAIQKFRNESGAGQELTLGAVRPSDDDEILALSYRIDGAGQPSVFMGAVPSGTSVSKGRLGRLHQQARDHAKDVQDEVDPERADRDVSTGVASAGSVTGWDQMVADYAYQYDDCPYGSVYLGGEVYEKEGTSYFGYGVDHVHRSNPGSNYCDSSTDYSLNDAYCNHNWDKFDRDPPILHEYHPDTNKNGNFSVSGDVGYSGGNIGVSYDPPDVSRDVTAGQNGSENVKWDWDYTWDPDNPAQHEPASVIKSEEEALHGTYGSNKLLEVEGGAYFYDSLDGTRNTDTSLTIYAER